jgi:hypothetical protein
MPTSADLMRMARACADRVTLPRKPRQFPSFSEVEEQCGDQYEELLQVLHEDEVFEAADLDEQERLVEAIRAGIAEARQDLVESLVDNQAAQVWLQQEGAFHLGLAIGMKLAKAGHELPAAGEDDADEEQLDDREREDKMRFGRHRSDPNYMYDEDDEDQDEGDDEDDEDDDPYHH